VKTPLTIGTRGSDLALWQAHHVAGILAEKGVETKIKIIKTSGDVIQHLSFDKMEGKGFFTKEIEEALLNKSIDLAVHSCKDLETEGPDGLCIAAMTTREDPADLLLIAKAAYAPDNELFVKASAVVGTSSMRRKAQLRHFRSDIEMLDLRGNVPTRIQKLREGKYDAIVIAMAGVKRLGADLSDFVAIALPPQIFVPAPAQGVLAIQCRISDTETYKALRTLHHEPTAICAEVEREILRQLEGGCQLPFGAYCRVEGDFFLLDIAFASHLTSPLLRITIQDRQPRELVISALNKLR
jgi:hydroxymethylbilane synthase